MAQAVIIDLIIAALLLLALMLGAQKGLLKSIAGLVILLVSLAGAVLVSNVATPMVSDAVKPMLMEVIEENLPELTDSMEFGEIDLSKLDFGGLDLSLIDLENVDLSGIRIGGIDLGTLDLSGIDFSQLDPGGAASSAPVSRALPAQGQEVVEFVSGLLEQIDPAQQLETLLDEMNIDPELAAALLEAALEKMVETGADLVDALVEVVLETAVHAVLFLLTFLVLNILLRILLAAMNLVLMLPGLRTLNSLGGAVIAFVEVALMLFLVVWVARRCAIDVTELAQGTLLFRFFVNNTPLSVISLL